LSVGTILIDRQGNIIDTNEEARAISAAASPISRIGNRLHLTGSAQHKFKSAVRRLAGSADAAPQTLEADDGCTCISLMIRRVEDVIGAKTRYPVAFIVYLKDREQPLPPGAVEYVMQAFGLSRAEARLTVLLAGGHTLEDSAVRLDVTLTTARTYCKRALVKTRTNRQAELVWLISNSLARLA
jgi:DNA-binding CsgD family transcriptional regulator